MGKIKGWSKVKDNNLFTYYKHDKLDSTHITIYKKIDLLTIVNRGKKSFNNMTGSYAKGKKKAIAYMRSH